MIVIYLAGFISDPRLLMFSYQGSTTLLPFFFSIDLFLKYAIMNRLEGSFKINKLNKRRKDGFRKNFYHFCCFN